jgi:zinc D-Ala-D-Ala carboxypeptidase
MGDLSEHFNRAEFFVDEPDPGPSVAQIDPELVTKLEQLRALLDTPIKITSGWRSHSHNQAVQGASDSQHLIGKAADIYWEGFDPNAGRKYAMEVGFTGIGVYTAHLHVDTRDTLPYLWVTNTP